ncbi:unnamed protein product [Gordionus sp. m RMFG-2023]
MPQINPLMLVITHPSKHPKLGKILEENAKFYVSELVLGITFLHSKVIAHRDIKPRNVMLDEDSHLRITFGLCKKEIKGKLVKLLDWFCCKKGSWKKKKEKRCGREDVPVEGDEDASSGGGCDDVIVDYPFSSRILPSFLPFIFPSFLQYNVI